MSKIIFYCAASVLALTACASNEDRRQAAELTRAQTLVDQAQQAGAQQFASADLEAARNKLEMAQNKHTGEDAAERLAQEAAADANVALARTRAMKSQQALNQVNAGHDSLRQETTQQSSRDSGSTVPMTEAPAPTTTMPSSITESPPVQPGAQQTPPRT